MPVNTAADQQVRDDVRPFRARWALLAFTGLCFLVAGGLLWWRHGAAVFTDYVLVALAWCF